MKHVHNTRYLTPLFCLFVVVACSKRSTDLASKPNNNNNAANASTASTSTDTLGNNMTSGTWIISAYTQRTEDKSSQFKDVVFTFSKDGSITATKGGTSISGTWTHTSSSVGYYGAAPSKASVTFGFGTSKPFDLLTRTWNVVSSDTTNLALVNPEPADDEHLTFSKQ